MGDEISIDLPVTIEENGQSREVVLKSIVPEQSHRTYPAPEFKTTFMIDLTKDDDTTDSESASISIGPDENYVQLVSGPFEERRPTIDRVAELDDILPDTQQNPSTPPSFEDELLSISEALEIPPSYPTPAPSPSVRGQICDECDATPTPLQVPPQKLSCRERKRIIVPMNRPPNITKAMKSWLHKTFWLLDPFRENEDCWFHPDPPPPRVTPNGTLRCCGNIQKCFTWQDRRGKHAIILNFGIVSKILHNKMTKQQIDGFVSKQWHLSHLCGNWTCLNPAHTTVEPGSINIGRNNCFSHRSGCGHNPPCMKDKKVALGADGRLVDPTASPIDNAASQISDGQGDWGDWRYDNDDGEGMLGMDGMDESYTAIVVEDLQEMKALDEGHSHANGVHVPDETTTSDRTEVSEPIIIDDSTFDFEA